MNFPEMMFYAEAEGLLPTRSGKINAVIKDIKAYPALTIDFLEFERILENHELKYSDLTKGEIRYINANLK